MKICVEVVTGFLGAGKSAFINSLIRKTVAQYERIVVLCCENGNTTITKHSDKGFIKVINYFNDSSGIKDLIINSIEEYKPHRIIIEYNGTENLSYLYESLFNRKIEKKCKLYTMYFICDGKSIVFYIKNMGEILLPFIQNSDVILINNSELMKQEILIEGKRSLEELNNRAHILICKNNNDIDNVLEHSNLIEKENIRDLRVRIMNYFNN